MSNEIGNLLSSLDSAKPVVKTSDEFRSHLASFIAQQTQTVQGQDVILDAINQEILAKLRTHDLDVDQLMRLYKTVSTSKSDYTRSLLDIFKPTSNTTNPLLPPKENSDDDQSSIGSLTTEQLGAIEKFTQVMDRMTRRQAMRESSPAGSDED